MVLNVTNKCNLACTYCYEYGEDKIVDTQYGKQPKFMADETAEETRSASRPICFGDICSFRSLRNDSGQQWWRPCSRRRVRFATTS